MRTENKIRLVVAAVLALGVAVSWLDRDLPLGRDASIHASIAEHLAAHGFRAWEICSDPELMHEHGCGFAISAAPFTRVFGLDVGLRMASLVGTAAFIVAVIAFFRRFNGDVDLGAGDVPLELVIACANPIVIAQFWSACPDALFGACAIASFVLLDRLLRDDQLSEMRTAMKYTVVVMLAVLITPVGLAIYPLHAAWAVWRRRELTALGPACRRRIALLVVSWSILVAWVVLAKLGKNPFLELTDPRRDTPVPYVANVKELALFVALVFGVLAIAALPRLAVTWRDGHLALALGGFVHLLTISASSAGNLRAYLPIIPFATLYVVRALRARCAYRIRVAVLVIFVATQTTTVVMSLTGALI